MNVGGGNYSIIALLKVLGCFRNGSCVANFFENNYSR